MDALPLGAAVSFFADALVLVVLWLLYRQEPQRWMRWWVASYALGLFQHIFVTGMLVAEDPRPFSLGAAAVALLTAVTLNVGTWHFVEQPPAWRPLVVLALLGGAMPVLAFAGIAPSYASIPVLIALTWAYGAAGWAIARRGRGYGKWLAVAGLFGQAAHQIDFVATGRWPEFAPWGLAINGGLLAMTGFGLILMHLDRARREAERNRGELRALVRGAAVGIFRTTLEGQITLANPAIVEMLGYDSEAEVLALRLPDGLYVEPRERDVVRDAASAKGVLAPREVLFKRKDGQRIRVELSGREVLDEKGARIGWEGFARDVTRTRALEFELARAQRMEALGRLAGGIAHDFNNLLTVILGNLSLVASERGGDEDETLLGEATLAAERAAALTKQLLLFGRPAGVSTEGTDARAAIEKLGAIWRRTLGERIELNLDLPDGPCRVAVHAAPFEQVAMNLVLNARDAMPEGGTLRVSLSSAAQESTAVLEVTDDGEGIAEDHFTHLFEPFFTTRAPSKGTGLGLATVYSVVHGAGGTIDVESAVGRGTTFRVHLPRHLEALDEREGHREARVVVGPLSILVVEDQDDVRKLVVRMLERAGHAVRAAMDAEEAEMMLREDPPDVLLTDVVMPGRSGPELVRRIRADGIDVPVIYMSGYADPAVVDRPLDAPLLYKPFVSEELTQMLASLPELAAPRERTG